MKSVLKIIGKKKIKTKDKLPLKAVLCFLEWVRFFKSEMLGHSP